MKFSEDQLKLFAAPLSETEDQKCKNAIGMVRDALKNLGFNDEGKAIEKMYSDTYAYSLEMRSATKNRKVRLFVKGSYANNTNVRTESDVDIAVVLESTFKVKYRPNINDSLYGFSDSTDSVQTFKDEVEIALKRKFGKDVERKNKSIKIHGNTYRVDADTVPCMRHRDYTNDYSSDPNNFLGGIFIQSDDGQTIVNYPEQHIKNGREKNNRTKTYYKKMVRIIKKMRYIMQDEKYESSNSVSSFGLESLLWNLPDEVFTKYSIYRYAFGEVMDYLVKNTNMLANYKEANGIKPLCNSSIEIENYIRFIKDLYYFNEYDI
ncbi:nucleotidyltransferase domain-containing protein [Heyndrickxia ginsengihumi]|uniref:nucleotidyltransferase domain-containing protein n=1 Tax=Heyndrickxia ginsengihumi TaxID=363870 RepID=UPI000472BDB4|nr:nucleotidyltransferase [Heyndrickxia ginsengihumi]